MTVSGEYAFTVKETGDGTPFIALEPRGTPLTGAGLPRGSFYLDLRRGTTIEQARQLAKFCNSHVEKLTFTAG